MSKILLILRKIQIVADQYFVHSFCNVRFTSFSTWVKWWTWITYMNELLDLWMKHSRQFVPLHSNHRCSERSEEYSQRTQLHPSDLRLPHCLLHGKKLYGVSGAAEREPPVQNSFEIHQEIFTQVHCQKYWISRKFISLYEKNGRTFKMVLF